MTIIYLSPHFDDAILSCGGLIYTQVQSGEHVEVWTMCTRPGAFTPQADRFHKMWNVKNAEEAMAVRNTENDTACKLLGITHKELGFCDMIYRGDTSVFTLPSGLITWKPADMLISPLAILHIDHSLTRRAAEALKRPLTYYAEVPYLWRYESAANKALSEVWRGELTRLPQHLISGSLEAWIMASLAYKSQISMLFGFEWKLQNEITEYFGTGLFTLYNSERQPDIKSGII
jgi:LmbE family N-acetylglucosaminyl deacetylase